MGHTTVAQTRRAKKNVRRHDLRLARLHLLCACVCRDKIDPETARGSSGRCNCRRLRLVPQAPYPTVVCVMLRRTPSTAVAQGLNQLLCPPALGDVLTKGFWGCGAHHALQQTTHVHLCASSTNEYICPIYLRHRGLFSATRVALGSELQRPMAKPKALTVSLLCRRKRLPETGT